MVNGVYLQYFSYPFHTMDNEIDHLLSGMFWLGMREGILSALCMKHFPMHFNPKQGKQKVKDFDIVIYVSHTEEHMRQRYVNSCFKPVSISRIVEYLQSALVMNYQIICPLYPFKSLIWLRKSILFVPYL